MREQSPLDRVLAELNYTEKNIREWESLRSTVNFKALIAFLEARYVEAGGRDAKSLAELRAINAERQLIRDIFAFTRYDFDEKQRLMHELKTLQHEEEG